MAKHVKIYRKRKGVYQWAYPYRFSQSMSVENVAHIDTGAFKAKCFQPPIFFDTMSRCSTSRADAMSLLRYQHVQEQEVNII